MFSSQLTLEFALAACLAAIVWPLPSAASASAQPPLPAEARSCTDGFAPTAAFGEVTTIELDFGPRTTLSNSKCSAPFHLPIASQMYCQVCGDKLYDSNRLIGKRKILGYQDVTDTNDRSASRRSVKYLLEAKTDNPMWMTCSGASSFLDGAHYTGSLPAYPLKKVVDALETIKIGCHATPLPPEAGRRVRVAESAQGAR